MLQLRFSKFPPPPPHFVDTKAKGGKAQELRSKIDKLHESSAKNYERQRALEAFHQAQHAAHADPQKIFMRDALARSIKVRR